MKLDSGSDLRELSGDRDAYPDVESPSEYSLNSSIASSRQQRVGRMHSGEPVRCFFHGAMFCTSCVFS